jgi:hypothetical protein
MMRSSNGRRRSGDYSFLAGDMQRFSIFLLPRQNHCGGERP